MDPANTIVPRQGPDFGFDRDDIPRHWLGGDAFKSRFFDAMSLLFPEGEKFFIACVRDYRDQVKDPQLAAQVKDFMYQEGQHGMVHNKFNARIAAQGVNVDAVVNRQKTILFDVFRKKLPKVYTLAHTAAAEHLTALMAHGFSETDIMDQADPRVRAMYAWHSVEEIEHKAVAYDVFQKVAKGGYFTRILAMLHVSLLFPLHVFMIMAHMFKVDGVQNKTWTWLKGLWWLYGWNGVYPRLMPHYFAYFLPGFHPWKFGNMDKYKVWLEAYQKSGGNAIAASDAAVAAATA